MRVSFAVPALAFASAVFAAPVAKPLTRRAADIDGVILNYALTLEHLEAAFYKGGLDTYNETDFEAAGFPDWVYYRLTEIASHEQTHVGFLTTALDAAGINATGACEYSFPYTSPATFLALAQVLEGVGTSAITNPAYLTAAGSILTVEARHSSWIRSSGLDGDGFQQAFDTPLDFDEVYSLAAQFITSCPASNPALPVKAFPVLTVAPTTALTEGETVTLTYTNQTAGFAVFLSALGQTVVEYPASGSVAIPTGLFGQTYVVITSANATVTDDITLAIGIVEVGIQATTFSY